jgi:tetratricopeptide (TPR) repeat protein
MARIDHLDEKTRDLVKVASVIGRTFFYRLVKEVTKTTEDIDSRLSYLKKIQLIRERRRLDELEYLFKHALAQETAYESILLRKRRQLHHTVADSIEKVFKEKLHEFYGMLAFHYSKAEDEEKAEEYLTKAGEEALRSSASSEALHYYREALDLYLRKYGDAADPEKIAMFEKNIAVAFHARGHHTEALGYFDKSLAHYWGRLPTHSILVYSKFVFSFLHMLIGLYLPFLRFRKVPTARDSEILNLYYKKLESLIDIDPKRFFIEAGFLASRLTSFDLTRAENGLGLLASMSNGFSWPGISFRISRKLLEFPKEKIDKDDLKSMSYYDLGASVLSFVNGDWDTIRWRNDNEVNQLLNAGEFLNTSVCLLLQGWIKIDQGHFDEAEKIVDKLAEIGELYDNDYSRAYQHELNVKLQMKRRRFQQALQGVTEGIDFISKTAMKVYIRFFYTMKARMQIMLGDIKGAKVAFSLGKEYGSEVMAVPYYRSCLLICESILGLHELEASIESGKAKELAKNRRAAFRTGKTMVRTSCRVACGRTESYKLMGIYYWLIGKQKKALQSWRRSIQEGERIAARLELSRTYMEVGKRLLEPKSKYKELNGMTAEEYLQKARTMFEEMGLEWDLDELARIPSTN